MNIKCLAVTTGSKFGVMLVNYDTNKNYGVNVAGLTGTINYYEVSADHLTGLSRSIDAGALGNLNLPAMSVVLIRSG